jgi:hypothetical protein
MLVAMTSRACWALFAAAALAAVPGLLAQDGVIDDRRPGSMAVVVATDGLDPLVATPARSHSMHAALRGVPLGPLTVAIVVAVAGIIGRRRHQLHGLHVRLGDVGDAWRALLLGAPPILL